MAACPIRRVSHALPYPYERATPKSAYCIAEAAVRACISWRPSRRGRRDCMTGSRKPHRPLPPRFGSIALSHGGELIEREGVPHLVERLVAGEALVWLRPGQGCLAGVSRLFCARPFGVRFRRVLTRLRDCSCPTTTRTCSAARLGLARYHRAPGSIATAAATPGPRILGCMSSACR